MQSLTAAMLREKLALTVLCEPDHARAVSGGYCGDLLSRVMGRAASGCVWITIMDNVNTIAVASLSDAACVILAEGVTPAEAVVERAESAGINFYKSEKSAFELCVLCGNEGIAPVSG